MSHHKIKCWWTLVPPCGLLYIVVHSLYVRAIVAVSAYVHMYIYLPTQLSCAPSSIQNWGTERSPFFIQPCGACYSSDQDQEQERLVPLRTQGPPVQMYIFTHDHLWLSYSNPKVSISSSPAFLYCIMCTCICFMLFRSTCSWPFSEENPLRVASEALNIHLVSLVSITTCTCLHYTIHHYLYFSALHNTSLPLLVFP